MVTTNSNIATAEGLCGMISEMTGILMPVIKYVDQPIDCLHGRRGIKLSPDGYREFFLCRDGQVWVSSATAGRSVEEFLHNRMYVAEHYAASSQQMEIKFLADVIECLISTVERALRKLEERRESLAHRVELMRGVQAAEQVTA